MISVSASAQDKPAPVELSPTQIETNNRAVRMLGETPPRTKEAIKLVEAALLMEKQGDLLYLTLGRAYQLDGQCARAAEQFDAAERAPGVQGVPEDFVPGQLGVYRKELESCMGSLIISCEPDDLELVIDGTSIKCGEELSLEPGSYRIMGENPNSGIEVEIPVQVVSGEVTRSDLKIPGGTDGSSTRSSGMPEDVEVEQLEVVDPLSWRVTPFVGAGVSTNVLELTTAPLVDGRYASFADQVALLGIGAEGRVLKSSGSLRYGVGGELRFARSVVDDLDGNDEFVFVDLSVKAALYPQLWFSRHVGLFAGAVLRPRFLGVEVGEINGPDDGWDSTSFAVGGGLKAELGSLLGLQGLELSAAWLAPLTGTNIRLYAPDFEYTDQEPPNAVPPLEIGARLQIKEFTAAVMWEGWFTDAVKIDCEGDGCFDNQRSSQVMLTVGWSFGSTP